MNGLTSREAENLITERLKAYVKERPTVVVRMSGFKVSVLGEVASPGVYPVVNEQINVLEALAMAGDLTIYGVRDNVKLIREDANGKQQIAKTVSVDAGDIAAFNDLKAAGVECFVQGVPTEPAVDLFKLL